MTISTYPRTCLVTGATSGIGLALMEALAARGVDLIGIGRSPENCQIQSERLGQEYPQRRIRFLVADLSSQPQIRDCARQVIEILEEWNGGQLDALINNAGTFTFWQSLTGEGFETQWAVNHLAPFLLSNLLLPSLRKSPQARIITISSGSHYGAKLDWSDIQGLGRYNPLRAYKRSKLANVLFTAELNRRLGEQEKLLALVADPGLVNTGIGGKSGSKLVQRFWNRRRKKGIPPADSAAGILKLLDPDLLPQQGQIYWKNGVPKRPDPYSLSEDHAWRLWEISAQMTGIN